MKKTVFFAFNGEMVYFQHVLLNALEMKEKGDDVQIVMEGETVTLIEKLDKENHFMFKEAKEKGIINSVCRACTIGYGALPYNETCGIPLSEENHGHPSMQKFINQGYDVITL